MQQINAVMGQIIDNMNQNIEAEDGDYFEDGLLHCGKCHTPKQFRLRYRETERIYRCLCKCDLERREAEAEKERRREFEERVKRFRKMGFPDSEMARWTFDKDDHQNEKVSDVAQRYADNFELMKQKGKGLLLYGTVGTGKTFIASCIANELISKGYPCLVTNFSRLINTIQAKFEGRQSYIDELSNFDLIVIDDLASERDTEYINEIIQSIIDSRYRSGLPLIITTNLTADELKNPADIRKQRIYSRLFEMCIPLEVKGSDRRREKLKADYKELEGILGL